MKKIKALKEYDQVKISNPTFVMRVGFPLFTSEVISSWSNSDKTAITRLLQRLSGEPVEEVSSAEYSDNFIDTFSKDIVKPDGLYQELAMAVMRRKKFGGDVKSLHVKEFPDFLNC